MLRSSLQTSIRLWDELVGVKELSDAFATLNQALKQLLRKRKIQFKFNTPNAAHFGGIWERKVTSMKTAVQVTLGTEMVTEEVLNT